MKITKINTKYEIREGSSVAGLVHDHENNTFQVIPAIVEDDSFIEKVKEYGQQLTSQEKT